MLNIYSGDLGIDKLHYAMRCHGLHPRIWTGYGRRIRKLNLYLLPVGFHVDIIFSVVSHFIE